MSFWVKQSFDIYVCVIRYQIYMETVSKSTEHDREISKAFGTSAIKSDAITTPQLPSTTVTLPDQDAEHHCLKNVPVNNIQQGSSIKHVFSSLRDTFDIHFNPNVFCAGALLSFWDQQTIVEIYVWLNVNITNIFIHLTGVCFPKESTEDIQKQKQQLKDAAVFLISNQIPAFVSCFL